MNCYGRFDQLTERVSAIAEARFQNALEGYRLGRLVVQIKQRSSDGELISNLAAALNLREIDLHFYSIVFLGWTDERKFRRVMSRKNSNGGMRVLDNLSFPTDPVSEEDRNLITREMRERGIQ